jgi:hypothetical protein
VRSSAHLIILATCLSTAPALADDEHEEHAEEHEHHHHVNHVALFLGATSTLGDMSATHFTIGADYEHRLPFLHEVGVGVLVDSAIASETETLLAGFVAVHPIGGLMLLGAAGAAVTGLGHDGHLGLRAGAAYFFPVGELSVGPEVSLDHVNGENAVVYGISAGTGF